MKRISVFAFILCIIASTACSVKQSDDRLCISDTYTPVQAPAFTLSADIPEDAAQFSDADSSSVFYELGDYEIFRETFFAESAEEGLERITGKSTDTLNVIPVSDFPQEEYRFTWTAAGENDDFVCSGTMFFDGSTCYSLTIQCPASLENRYRSGFYHILSNAELQPV